ncbi:hypothetical protein WJX72_006243 [[Myrmecia] bisecta]|uniref:Gamma carbonic anhydrase n=1 Tax=[Myrmecia] bisecta TaxID=41462 RepID=A0AAW1R6T9_9CHLO
MAVWKTLGSILRQTGKAFENVGCGVQGKYAYREALPKHRTLQPFGSKRPSLGQDTFVAPNASLIGDVSVGRNSSVWYGAVLRGDVNSIRVGENTNIQDGVIVHVAKNNPQNKPAPTLIGSNVTVGHGAIVHACTIEDGALVGMGATLLDGVTVEKGSIVAAGSLVRAGSTVSSGQIWAGNPAKFLRSLEEGEAAFINQSAVNYASLAAVHAEENAKTVEEIEEDKAKRLDRAQRDPDYDSHLGLERDPVSRAILHTADHT